MLQRNNEVLVQSVSFITNVECENESPLNILQMSLLFELNVRNEVFLFTTSNEIQNQD